MLPHNLITLNDCLSLSKVDRDYYVTRFYLPSSGAAAVSPAYDASWNNTALAGSRLKTVTTKISSTMTTLTIDDANSSLQEVLAQQYVSDPITAQTITAQAVKFYIRASQDHIDNNLYLICNIKVVSNDGSVKRGDIHLGLTNYTEFVVSTLTNRKADGTSTEVIASEGDRIVFEIGAGGNPGGAENHDYSFSIGDDSGTDLPENETETAAYNPWIEFANNITFQSAGAVAVKKYMGTVRASLKKINGATLATTKKIMGVSNV